MHDRDLDIGIDLLSPRKDRDKTYSVVIVICCSPMVAVVGAVAVVVAAEEEPLYSYSG